MENSVYAPKFSKAYLSSWPIEGFAKSVHQMIKVDKKTLERMTLHTGLKLSTCLDLITEGWTYVEEIDKPSRWESPIAQLRKE